MELSYQKIWELIQKKLPESAWLIDFYDDRVIYEDKDRKYYEASYSLTNGQVTLGDKTEVQKKVDYVKVQAAVRLTAAVGESGSEDFGYKWKVQIIDFGPDKQGLIYWDPEALRAAKPLYEGAKVFALSEAQHQAKTHPYGKSVRDLVGWISDVAENEKGFEGYFNILKAAKWLRDSIVDAWERGKKDLIGLSNDVDSSVGVRMVGGKKMKAPVKITGVTVDVVYDPAAGGKFLRLAAAVEAGQKEAETMEKLLAALKAHRPEAYKSIEAKVKDGTVTEEEVINLLAAVPSGEGLKGAQEGGKPAEDDNLKAAQKVLDDARIVACGIALERELSESKLPELSMARVKKLFAGKVFEAESLKAAIKEEKEYIDKLTGSGVVMGSGAYITEDDFDKRKKMLDDFFEGKVHSFKAAYINLTGDDMVTGQLKAARLRASIDSTSFAEILGDSVQRKMVKDYNAAGMDDWKKIADSVPLSDFRTNRRPRMGGYGDLPTVAQGGAYNALASPGDEEATYTPSKKGGTEDITLEAIKNDDVGAIRRVPLKMARAAKRTLHKFVFDFLSTNPTIYDAVALFHANHANLGSTALAAASLTARRQAMLKQTELNSAEVLGIPPKYLLVPVDLDKTGYDLIAAPRNSDFNPTAPDFTRTVQMELIVVPHWTDTNNWFLAADKNDIPTIEIGFLDGKEEPEIFVQDLPNVGSMFNNDKLTYKIRHIYGGAVIDYRGLDGSLVA